LGLIGLTTDERRIIENAFRSGTIQILTATTTLASGNPHFFGIFYCFILCYIFFVYVCFYTISSKGVNLPARRVILRSPFMGRSLIDAKSYRQMKGRAGRKGQDTHGESILLVKPADVDRVKGLLNNPLAPVSSCLISERRGMKRALLEVIAASIAKSSESFERYGACSMLMAEMGADQARKVVQDAVEFLVGQSLISQEGDAWVATKLGYAGILLSTFSI
jgi:DNA polymerase theta